MKSVFDYFEEIMNIPRESGKEEKIAQYLIEYAKENNIEYKLGKYNTVFLRKNNNSNKTIILQAHSDMVCVSTNDYDFDNKGIPFYIDGDYYKSKCTSLGADDGIGVAIILTIMQESNNMPNIEAMITTEEETTMIGATCFDYSQITGKTLISLDGIREGEIESASAGMCSTTLSKNINYVNDNNKFYKLSISGLAGGHSGDDIDKSRTNAIKLTAQILETIGDVKIASIEIGKRDNVIPSEGYVEFSSKFDLKTIKEIISNMDLNIGIDDKNFSYVLEEVNGNRTIKESSDIINLLNDLKNGLLEVYKEDNFPLLSANIGKILLEDNNLIIKYSIRSSDIIKEDKLINETIKITNKYEFKFIIDSKKPFFPYKKESKIRELLKENYKELYGKDAIVKKIHAGLEGGILANNIEGLDICTIAPTIENCHSVNECVSISSTKRVYEWLKETLKKYNK